MRIPLKAAVMNAAILAALLSITAPIPEAAAQVRILCPDSKTRATACVVRLQAGRTATQSARLRTNTTKWVRLEFAVPGQARIDVFAAKGANTGSIELYNGDDARPYRRNPVHQGVLAAIVNGTPGQYRVLKINKARPVRIEVVFTPKPLRRMVCAKAGYARETACVIAAARSRPPLKTKKKNRAAAGLLKPPANWSRTLRGTIMAWDGPVHWYKVRVTQPGNLTVEFQGQGPHGLLHQYYRGAIITPRNDAGIPLAAVSGVHLKSVNVTPGDVFVWFGLSDIRVQRSPNTHKAYSLSVRFTGQ